MMGVGYLGSNPLPTHKHKLKFAWRPILTTSGKWIWWRRYVKLKKVYWGPAGELPAIELEYYTEGEWLLETIKNDYHSTSFSQPPTFFKSSRKSKGP